MMLRLQISFALCLVCVGTLARPSGPTVARSQEVLDPEVGFETAGDAYHLDSLRIIQLPTDPRGTRWSISERDKLELRAGGTLLIDVTDIPSIAVQPRRLSSSFKYPTPNSSFVDALLPKLSKKNMEDNLLKLTSLHTRYYNSETGLQGSQFLYETLSGYAEESELRMKSKRSVTVMPFHHSFKQYSIIVRIANPDSTPESPITVIGAHIDSLNIYDPFGPAPGADDDGSGTVTSLEACRVLLQSGYIPKDPIEFHFYAGEEGGLLGSGHIVSHYAGRQPALIIKGMLQLDMTAWVANGTGKGHVGISTNHHYYADDLAAFNRKLVDRYLDIPWVDEPDYPRGASDSYHWEIAGFPASDALEGTWDEMRRNRKLHGPGDHQYHPEFSFDHMLEYAKLAVAFMVELGGHA